MHTAHRTPTLALTTIPAADLSADLLVVPVFEDDTYADAPGIDAATGGDLSAARERGEFKAQPFESFITAVRDGWTSRRLLCVGLGKAADLTTERLRRLGTTAVLACRQRQVTSVTVLMRGAGDTGSVSLEAAVQAIGEGAVLGNFEGASYRTTEPPKPWVDTVTIRVASLHDTLATALTRGRILGESSNIARALANEPGNTLTPRVFADRAVAVATEAGLSVEVLDEQAIAALGMGMLLGVASGSAEPPRLIVLRHQPKHAVPGVVLGLVGKGITFDTGGISIKPAQDMDKMKDDMSGGAAVLGAMTAIARLDAPVTCIGVIPTTENMPGGRAFKPGDILKSAEGKTVEILNTDAEGRLILGDGLWYARQLGATHLVDIATLTGACVVALGKTTSGVFGRPDGWVEDVRQASARAGDRSWPMPVFDDYREQLRSEIADFTNQGSRAGGAITAAMFLKEFAGELPWVHLDIAGTAWAEEAKPWQPKGATGVGVRTLAELALAARSWGKGVGKDVGKDVG